VRSEKVSSASTGGLPSIPHESDSSRVITDPSAILTPAPSVHVSTDDGEWVAHKPRNHNKRRRGQHGHASDKMKVFRGGRAEKPSALAG